MRGDRDFPPLDYDDALEAALKDCMPFVQFWHEAEQRFDPAVREALQEHFSENVWQIAGEYAETENDRTEIYREIRDYKIKELTK